MRFVELGDRGWEDSWGFAKPEERSLDGDTTESSPPCPSLLSNPKR